MLSLPGQTCVFPIKAVAFLRVLLQGLSCTDKTSEPSKWLPRNSSFLAGASETTLRDGLLDLGCTVVAGNMNSYRVSLLKIISDCGGEYPMSETGCGATGQGESPHPDAC